MDFSSKTIWITGASSGIGEALVYEFSKLGSKIIISSRRSDELERVKANCATPENIMVQPLDLAKHEEIKEIAKQIVEKNGSIDILINNGGISQRALTTDTPLEIDKKIMDINYFGTICLTKEVLPSMLKKKQGHIVTISSLTGKFGTPLRSAYAASKHALHGFFDTLRSETWRDNIDVTLICPGYVHTNVSVNALTSTGKPQNSMDPETAAGLKPEDLAKSIIKAVKNKKQELVIGGKETLGVYLKRFFPKLFSKIIRKQLPESKN
jgi:dehydrogenase/reductase SDR family protein 7B